MDKKSTIISVYDDLISWLDESLNRALKVKSGLNEDSKYMLGMMYGEINALRKMMMHIAKLRSNEENLK